MLADMMNLQIISEDGVTTTNQNSDFLYKHLSCPDDEQRTQTLAPVSNCPSSEMLQESTVQVIF
jgi:hypothetical protein